MACWTPLLNRGCQRVTVGYEQRVAMRTRSGLLAWGESCGFLSTGRDVKQSAGRTSQRVFYEFKFHLVAG